MTFKRLMFVATRFVVVGSLSAVTALGATLAIQNFAPRTRIEGAEFLPPLAALGLGALAVWFFALSIGRKFWRSVQIALIATLFGACAEAWWLRSHLGWREWLGLSVSLFVVTFFAAGAQSLALGWITDNGERQKVTGFIRGQAIFEPTSWSRRLIEENDKKSQRRWTLVISGAVGFPLAIGCFELRGSTNFIEQFGMVTAGVVAAASMIFGWLPAFFLELLYQVGFQDMTGAKVLDPKPHRPGLVEVGDQRAHGDASMAGEAEAAALLA